MIHLFFDVLIAAVQIIDRALCAIEKRAQPPATPRSAVDGDAPPAGAGPASAAPSTGGHF